MSHPEAMSPSSTEIFDRKLRAKKASNHSRKRLVVLGEGQGEVNIFDQYLGKIECSLRKSEIEILQINLGKLCNLTCHHCHVEAGPDRQEIIAPETIEELLAAAEKLGIKIVDLTGGAPEMFPGFKEYVKRFRSLGCEVIVRSNLTILVEESFEDMIDFLAEQKVKIVASLPCYTEDNVDAQRGDGVFNDSIEALQRLNRGGYGIEGSGLILDLVYNPGGASLPGDQAGLELAYKKHLREHFDVEFNALYAITNLPIGRFYSDLKKAGKADEYDRLLRDNFNAQTIPHLMCINTLNVSWDGWVYDCDFNQMLEMPTVVGGKPLHVSNVEVLNNVAGNTIATGNHCFGCTAGAGSSCGGELL